MKKITLIAVALLTACVAAFAQPAPVPSARADVRKLDRVRYNLGDEMERNNRPITVLNSLYYYSSNQTDGVIFVRTNATVLVHIALPNPTNNIARRYQIITMGASTAILSNGAVVGTFFDANSMTNGGWLFVASNKTAVVYSTGTNWTAVLR